MFLQSPLLGALGKLIVPKALHMVPRGGSRPWLGPCPVPCTPGFMEYRFLYPAHTALPSLTGLNVYLDLSLQMPNLSVSLCVK